MLSFIQRILQPDTSRKRRRSYAFSTKHTILSEIEDLRLTIADNDPLARSEDREKAISDFLGTGERDVSPASTRRKLVGGMQDVRLSTIAEKREEESLDQSSQHFDEKEKEEGSDEEMVDVGLQPQTVLRSENSNDGVVWDQDLWMWKGGNTLQR